jgi:hypothetical protein
MDVNKLLRKTLAHFCCFCVDLNFFACENLAWIEHWQVEMLIPNSMGYIHGAMETTFQEDEWDEYGLDGDHLVACISLGNNFVIFVEEGNEEGANFYILLCTQACFVVDQPFTCP